MKQIFFGRQLLRHNHISSAMRAIYDIITFDFRLHSLHGWTIYPNSYYFNVMPPFSSLMNRCGYLLTRACIWSLRSRAPSLRTYNLRELISSANSFALNGLWRLSSTLAIASCNVNLNITIPNNVTWPRRDDNKKRKVWSWFRLSARRLWRTRRK